MRMAMLGNLVVGEWATLQPSRLLLGLRPGLLLDLLLDLLGTRFTISSNVISPLIPEHRARRSRPL